jgi:hypothetical protein
VVDHALVVGAALALAEQDLDVGVLGVVLLHRVDHDVVEVDRELRDETDLERLGARARAGALVVGGAGAERQREQRRGDENGESLSALHRLVSFGRSARTAYDE